MLRSNPEESIGEAKPLYSLSHEELFDITEYQPSSAQDLKFLQQSGNIGDALANIDSADDQDNDDQMLDEGVEEGDVDDDEEESQDFKEGGVLPN